MSEGTRLNKFLSEAGICSRRQADSMIESGKVFVNGEPAQMGVRVREDDVVVVDGERVTLGQKPVILAFYKPRGIVCTSEKQEKDNIIDFVNYPTRLTYAGRLDKESEGLMILTNQGELVNNMMRGANMHEKEYLVWVDKPVTAEFIHRFSEGIWIEELGVKTRECKVEKLGSHKIRVVLTQGLNRQIRRTCQALDYHVRKLIRVRIMNVRLGDLERGTYRNLTPGEIRTLYRTLGMAIPPELIAGQPKGQSQEGV